LSRKSCGFSGQSLAKRRFLAEVIQKLKFLNNSMKGFVFKSQRGSHAKYTNGHRTTVIPIHDAVARGILRSILIQTGIELDEFLKLL
jgi:predicted RNA binding protein YcfA (HicA-like mRNA interferase family)